MHRMNGLADVARMLRKRNDRLMADPDAETWTMQEAAMLDVLKIDLVHDIELIEEMLSGRGRLGLPRVLRPGWLGIGAYDEDPAGAAASADPPRPSPLHGAAMRGLYDHIAELRALSGEDMYDDEE